MDLKVWDWGWGIDIPQVASGPDPVPSRPAENPVSKIKGSRAPAAKKAASSGTDEHEAHLFATLGEWSV